jgi:hypothetical protein
MPYASYDFFPVGFKTKDIKLIILYRCILKQGLAVQIIGSPMFRSKEIRYHILQNIYCYITIKLLSV